MLKKLPKENMGTSNLGWLQSRFHFSFAQYRNPENINFGVLRVLNDDIVHPKSGFEMHPHNDMEIISYVVNGAITHKDSMGNEETLYRGEVQYMSAGTGVMHSEYNHGDEDLRLLQIWIYPPKKALPTLYGSHRFSSEQRADKLLHVVSSQDRNAPIKIYQDVDIFVCETANHMEYNIQEGKQVYFVLIEGLASINGIELSQGDAMELKEEKILHVSPQMLTHFLFIVMNTPN